MTLRNAFEDLATESTAQNIEDSVSTVPDGVALLSRLVKTLESIQVVDAQQRQRVTVDALTAGLTLGTVSSVGNVAAQTGMAGMDREMYINIAKQTYANSIRQRLTFQ